jgi:hypothetical protein
VAVPLRLGEQAEEKVSRATRQVPRSIDAGVSVHRLSLDDGRIRAARPQVERSSARAGVGYARVAWARGGVNERLYCVGAPPSPATSIWPDAVIVALFAWVSM